MKRIFAFVINAKSPEFFLLALVFAVHCSLFPVLAQPDTEPIPPPVIVVTKSENQKLDAETDSKERIKLSLEMMNSHLAAAEKHSADQDFDAMFRELGGFHGLLDNAMAYLKRQNSQSGRTLDNYKRLAIAVRGYSTRLEVIRRDIPIRYEDYVRKLLIHLREVRTKAAEPFFRDTVVPTQTP